MFGWQFIDKDLGLRSCLRFSKKLFVRNDISLLSLFHTTTASCGELPTLSGFTNTLSASPRKVFCGKQVSSTSLFDRLDISYQTIRLETR